MRVDAIKRRNKRAKRISAFKRGDRVALPGGEHGTLVRRLGDWQYWMVDIDGEALPHAYKDHRLRPARGKQG